jgi:transposase
MKIHNRRRISRQKYTIIFNSFVADITTLTASEIAGVNRKTADRYYNFFRRVIYEQAHAERRQCNVKNGIELDESYFGPRKVRGKQGRGAGRKIIVIWFTQKKWSSLYANYSYSPKERGDANYS